MCPHFLCPPWRAKDITSVVDLEAICDVVGMATLFDWPRKNGTVVCLKIFCRCGRKLFVRNNFQNILLLLLDFFSLNRACRDHGGPDVMKRSTIWTKDSIQKIVTKGIVA